jgi:hypothetical protein
MADPPTMVQWGQQILTQTLTAGVLVAGLKGFIKFAVTDRIAKSDADAKEYKQLWKDAVQSRRRVRREVEADETGNPSVPPPPSPDEDYEDETGVFRAIAHEDKVWEKQRTEKRPERIESVHVMMPTVDEPRQKRAPNLTPREEQRLQRYSRGDPLDTPREPAGPYRKKLPSRSDR